jgi:hypothetical protein
MAISAVRAKQSEVIFFLVAYILHAVIFYTPFLRRITALPRRSANAEERGTRKRGPSESPVNGIPIEMAGGYPLPSQAPCSSELCLDLIRRM